MISSKTQGSLLRSLSPDERKRVLEQCRDSGQYQNAYRVSERLGWAYILSTIAVLISLLTHKYILVFCFLPLAAIFGILRIRMKQKLFRLIQELAAQQIAARVSTNSQ